MTRPPTPSPAPAHPPAVEWRAATFSYAGEGEPAFRDVTLALPESELVLLAGRTGSGKSTLLKTVNGLVPTFTGGRLDGDVLVGGRSVLGVPPRELAQTVGYVGQDPLATFVTDVVEEELAYGMEQLGFGEQTMRRRVEETLDLLGIADLRYRPLRSLSGGEQQRVAIGAVLTMHPQVLVLDEPTSALDPVAAEDVLGILTRLVEDLGVSVLLAEHRLERVVPYVDRVVVLEDRRAGSSAPQEALLTSPVAPPLVELGRMAGWRPLPLTVREARRRAAALRLAPPPPREADRAPQVEGPALNAHRVVVRHGATVAVREVSLEVPTGAVVALMGRNGAGKSSLLWALQGSGRRDGGRVEVDGTDPAAVSPAKARTLVGLVPQNAADLLYLETVAQECAAGDDQAAAAPGTCRTILTRLTPDVLPDRHPRDLSEGQRLALVLAIALTARPRVVALDEPTRGLDYAAKEQLATVVGELAAAGSGVMVATHDVEFVARVASAVIVLAGGEVVSAGPTARVLAESPAFAPQMSKVLGAGWLTVQQVREWLP